MGAQDPRGKRGSREQSDPKTPSLRGWSTGNSERVWEEVGYLGSPGSFDRGSLCEGSSISGPVGSGLWRMVNWTGDQDCSGDEGQGRVAAGGSLAYTNFPLHPSRSRTFTPERSAVSGASVSYTQPRMQPGAWAPGAWRPRWGACVGVLSRPHLLLGPLFRSCTSGGAQASPASSYCPEKLVPRSQEQAGACR